MKRFYLFLLLIVVHYSVLSGNLINQQQDYFKADKQGLKAERRSPVSFVLKVSPLSYLIAPDINGFAVRYEEQSDFHYLMTEDEIKGIGLFSPNAKAGIGINTRIVLIDLLGGGGYFVSGALSGAYFTMDGYVKFRIGRVIALGLHAGFLHWSPEWDPTEFSYSGQEAVRFADVKGVVFGPVLTIGRKANFSFSIDYLTHADTYVSTSHGYQANRFYVDFGGLMLNLGFLLRVP